MNKTFLLTGIIFSFSACAALPSNLKIPNKFYADELGQCEIKYKNKEITAKLALEKNVIEPIIGFDWQKHHTEKSTSLRVDHEPLSKPIAFLSAAAHNAAYTKNPKDIEIVTDFIYKISLNNQFLNTITRDEALKTQCYAGGDTSAPCPSHAPQHLGINMTTYLISAIWLREYFSIEQFKTVDKYVDRIYRSYIEPYATLDRQQDGYITEMANLGIGRLAYATWKNDAGLAAVEFHFRFKQMDRAIEENGYIKGNSYRGVRGIFYHTMGVDVALTYIQLANAWNYPVPILMREKIKKSAELINIYSKNSKDFYNFPENKIPYNSSRNPADAAGIHQQAIALGTLMKHVVNVDFLSEPRYENLRRHQFIDVMVGFDPHCMFPPLS